MQLPGLLIEYLITGSCALIWVSGLFLVLGKKLPSIEDKRLILFLPGLYVLGMLVDYVAILTAKALKDRIEDPNESYTIRSLSRFISNRQRKSKKDGLASRTLNYFARKMPKEKERRGSGEDAASVAEIAYRSKELSQEYTMRSSRDRIARGAFVNSAMTTIVLSIFCPCSSPYLPLYITLPVGATVSILCFVMYYRFNRLTSHYRRSASKAIRRPQ